MQRLLICFFLTNVFPVYVVDSISYFLSICFNNDSLFLLPIFICGNFYIHWFYFSVRFFLYSSLIRSSNFLSGFRKYSAFLLFLPVNIFSVVLFHIMWQLQYTIETGFCNYSWIRAAVVMFYIFLWLHCSSLSLYTANFFCQFKEESS